ncbi:MAG TPA: urea ABC transporter permease [Candidatus Nitrosopelagicus sp.]|jgi:branched-chain amino acid transport system permease protein|nr:urea ABC transporter permease [Candidatus Nitrosopelagicus sp.]
MKHLLNLIDGDKDIGRGNKFWAGFFLVLICFFLYPTFVSSFRASNTAFYLLNIPMGFGLCLIWGYCGILSFGHVAYYGLAGYAYGIIAGNLLGNSWGPILGVLGGLVVCTIISGIFGYFVFYSRIQKWIIPILTLVFTLLLETFFVQTSGYQWRVGRVLLGGFNGMTNIPFFQIGTFEFEGYSFYYYCLVIVLVLFFGLRILVNSKFGQIVIGIREDELRTEMLGYDIRFLQCVTFIISANLAGISGLLYVQWGNYITPSQMGILQAALPVIWCAVGGRNSFIAVIFATIVLNWLSFTLSSQGNQYALVIIGTLLVVTMVFFPRGIVVMIFEKMQKIR